MEELEKIIGKFVLTILGSLILMGLILGFFALVGILTQVVEKYPILLIPEFVILVFCIAKMIEKN